MKNTDYRIGQRVEADIPMATGRAWVEGVVVGHTMRELHVQFTRPDKTRMQMTVPPSKVRPVKAP